MRIEFNHGNYSINAYRKNYKSSIKNKTRKSISDTIEISDNALKMLSNKDVTRSEKISEIANKIVEKKYKINTTEIVNKMIRDAYFNSSSGRE